MKKHISEVREFITIKKKNKNGSLVEEKIFRRAIAPYNFVELPDRVVTAELLPEHNQYCQKRHTGRIHCSLTTSSPLYIRSGMTPANFPKYSEPPKSMLEEEKKHCEAERQQVLAPFFRYPNINLPVIPGSSIRGMLRTLIEIITFSKIERVSGEQRLFFRAVAGLPSKDSLARKYKHYVSPNTIKAGYLKKDREGWYIQPAKVINNSTFAWVKENSVKVPNFKKFNDSEYKPQYVSVSYERVAIDKDDRANRLFAWNINLPGTYHNKGTLVTSGNMKQGDEPSPRRNNCVVFECLVFESNPNIPKLRLDSVAVEHYRNAITEFQKQSPFDKELGVLEENRPVFYCPPQRDNIVRFFGQSPNFRIAYSPQGDGHATTVRDFIPKCLRNPALIDLADAIFGWVKQDSEDEPLPEDVKKQRAGRVFVTDAEYKNAQNGIWYKGTSPDGTVTPQILASPKPTTFQHYLVQPDETEADKSKLKHYASKPVEETVIRGNKLYWHKGGQPDFEHPEPHKASSTQITKIKPIDKDVNFEFTIYFENLTNVELGALMWVLNIARDDCYRLKLGMGKPLGMGAVRIEPMLYLSNRKNRYEQLFNGDTWETSEILESHPTHKQLFENYMLEQLQQTGNFEDIPRIKMLLEMLKWPGLKNVEQTTRYLEIERDITKHYIGNPKQGDTKINEYKERPVLPTPLQVMKAEDRRKINASTPLPNPGTSVSKPVLKNPKQPNHQTPQR